MSEMEGPISLLQCRKKLGRQSLIDQDLFESLQVGHRIATEAATESAGRLPPLQGSSKLMPLLVISRDQIIYPDPP